MKNNNSYFNWSKPSSIIQPSDKNISELSSQTPSKPWTQPASTSISDSFKKMGLGGVGSLGGRMGELEKASMRLGQFKSMKTREEQEREIEANKEMKRMEIAQRNRELKAQTGNMATMNIR